MRFFSALILTLLGIACLSAPALAERRIALVVGNSAYQNVTRLDNPKNDASLIAATLADLGFRLIGGGAQLDLDKVSLDNAVQSFGRQIQGADVALFFYAGHGVQVSGSNYLVPVNANPTREADVDFQMVDVNLVLRQMQGSGTKLNLVILDACRNNPFGSRGLRAAEGGLAQMRAPEGTLISYATQPGSVAQDGADGHSPYTKALASTVRRAGLDIFQTFNQVGLAVKRSTGGAQQPWVSSSPIDGSFYFVEPLATPPGVAPTPAAQQQAALNVPQRLDPDRTMIKDSALLHEISNRLYELNFDPESLDSKNGLTPAIREFQVANNLPATGEATEGLLQRLRDVTGVKQWGSIVYDVSAGKWGMSWDHKSRKEAVAGARANCGTAKCPLELSFFGGSCGAFAASGGQWSLVARDNLRKARTAALERCAKSGKSCEIVGAVCADGAGATDVKRN
ncbi:caspase family protein [soil metagenome]